MDNISEGHIYEDNLDTLHTIILSNSFGHIAANLNTEWEQSQWEQLPSYKFTKQCKDNTLINITKPLKPQYFGARILQINAGVIPLHQTGDLIPLYLSNDSNLSNGCGIRDGEKFHKFNFGKKLHVPAKSKELELYVEGGCTLYLLWLFNTKEDFNIN
ncbi:hypothetical protein V8C35DRAFT_302560 [Trichoderma chlorosporum]